MVGGFAYLYLTNNSILRDYLIPPAPAPLPELTPEQKVSSLLKDSTIDAQKLVNICQSYPDIAQNTYRNRLLTISGNICGFYVHGLNSDKAQVTIDDTTNRKLILNFDLNKFASPALHPSHKNKGKYIIIGKELHYVSLDGKVRLRLFTEGQLVTQKARFSGIHPTAIILTAEGDEHNHLGRH